MQNVENFLKNLPGLPGIYQMLGADNKILYIGKAKNLKKRVASYFRQNISGKTAAMMSKVHDVKIMHTQSDAQALILECELIKKHKPRYNILLRDDKSFPFIMISNHRYPRIAFYRGARKKNERYFGPFPSVQSVKETIQLIQKVFLIRDCRDSYFANRSRPCLQYQIGRCSAPCVNKISKADYQHDIEHAIQFLQGKDDAFLNELTQKMHQAAEQLAFEKAKKIRDQIRAVRNAQGEQHITRAQTQDIDVLVLQQEGGEYAVGLLMIRAGNVLGYHHFFPKINVESTTNEIWEAFLTQYYLAGTINLPSAIVCDYDATFLQSLTLAIKHKHDKTTRFYQRLKQEHRVWLQMAAKDTAFALRKKLLQESKLAEQFRVLTTFFEVENIQRMECFDISHHMGEAVIASNVVFNQAGPLRSEYRRYKIEDVTAGDDYAAMQQALQRRFANKEKPLPEILVIDGGKGQLNTVYEVLSSMQIKLPVLMSISKGRARRADMDSLLICRDGKITLFEIEERGRHLLQFLRDEAHRYAVTAHQKAKRKRQSHSVLEDIPGIGAKKRKALLQYFGGLQGLQNKAVEDIAKAPGISLKLAEQIYQYLNK